MAYNLMVEIKKGFYIPLDISKSKLFERTSRYKETRYSLEEIDRFTSNFENLNALRKYLYQAEIIEPTSYDKSLSIRMPQKGDKPKKVMYDFLYQKDRKYLDNPSLLVRDIGRMQQYGDLNFCLEFALHFLEFYDCRDIAPELRYFFTNSIRNGLADSRIYERDENGDVPIIRMTKQLIYKFHHNYGDIVYDYDVIKYRNLHEIIAFCEHYHNKRLENNLEPRGKVKTLKKELNQISFEE